jgi:hypothetical protein
MDEIDEVVKGMEEESKALKRDLYKMCWYMRGSLSFEEAYHLDIQDRTIISEIIESNLETTKETQLPFF